MSFRTHIWQLGHNLIESDLEYASFTDVLFLMAPQEAVNRAVLDVLLRIVRRVPEQRLKFVKVREILFIDLLQNIVVVPLVDLSG